MTTPPRGGVVGPPSRRRQPARLPAGRIMALALAIDVGATKIALGMVDRGGQVVHRARLTTPSGRTADQTWSAVAQVARELLGTVPPVELVGVGIGSAGPLDPVAGTVSPVMIPAWRDFPLVKRAMQVAGGAPVSLTGAP